MKKQLEKAILKTLAYGDVFDWAMKIKEIDEYLIILNPKSEIRNPKWFDKLTIPSEVEGQILNSKLQVANTGKLPYYSIVPFLGNMVRKKKISMDRGYYFLPGRKELVAIRKRREEESEKKMVIVERTARWLKLIPIIKMVGVSGNLAIGNADIDDDIDLFIVTKKGTLWLTRLLTVLLVEVMGRRRKRGCFALQNLGASPAKRICKNKICLNFFVDEEYLAVPEKERDLYSAHEVAQMKPLWWRGNCYQKFLWENRWAKSYLGNEIISRTWSPRRPGPAKLNLMLLLLETLVKRLQLWYMTAKRGQEKIEKGRLCFWPEDKRDWVMKEYGQRIDKKEKFH